MIADTSVTITAAAADGSGVVSQPFTVNVMKTAASDVHILCTDDSGTYILNGQPFHFEMDEGEAAFAVSAEVLPAEAGQNIVWSSSNTAVAECEGGCVITHTVAGTAVITAATTDGSGKKASFTVEVGRRAKDISIDGPWEIASRKSIQLTAVFSPDNATNKAVFWKSWNTAAATVSATGKVTAKKVSRDTDVLITAQALDGSGIVAEYIVTVKKYAVTTLHIVRYEYDDYGNEYMYILDGETFGFGQGEGDQTLDVTYVTYPDSASQNVTWTSSNLAVASFGEDDEIIVHDVMGTAIVTCTASDGSGKKACIIVNVVPVLATGVTITGPNEVKGGASIQMYATVQPADATINDVVWESSDTSIATVDANGKVTAKHVKTATMVTIIAYAADCGGAYDCREILVTP